MTSEYVLAGYRVVTRVSCPEGLDPDLISMSECIVDLVPVEFDDWFADPVSAQRACADRPGAQVLMVGFAEQDVPAVLADTAKDGWTPEMEGTLSERLSRQKALPDPRPGRVLGYELVGFDSGWHTWACLGGLVDDVRQATGVRPGRRGLIEDERQARRAAEWLTASKLGDPKVFTWYAALLVACGK